VRVLDIDEDDCEDDDTGPSILRGSQCCRCGIVSRVVTRGDVVKDEGEGAALDAHHTFRAVAFLLGGGDPLPS
jgi:hypothetical protein